MRSPTAPLPTLMPNIKAVLGAPGPILLACAFGIYTFQYAAMANFLPTLLVDRLGLSISAAGTISAITVAANAVGNIFAGALAALRRSALGDRGLRLLLRRRRGLRRLLRATAGHRDRDPRLGEPRRSPG